MNGVRALKVAWLGARVGGLVSSRIGGAFADRLWFTPWRVGLSERARSREAAWLEPTSPLAVPFAGRSLAGFTAGTGPTVLLVHGWGDRASRMGAFIAPLVDAGFRVVGVDLPAHGDSPGRTTNAYEVAAAIRATATHVGGLHGIVAHSMGGAETLIALRQGLRLQRLVLLAPAYRLEHAMDKFQVLFNIPERSMRGLRARIERRFGLQVWDDLAGDLLASELEVPGLLFHDRDDPQVDLADGRRIAEAWRDGRLIETAGLGHDRLLRDSEVVAQTVASLAATDLVADVRRQDA